MSSIAEWQLQRRIERGVERGAPCTAIAVAFSSRGVNALVEEQLPTWQEDCRGLGAKNETPVIVRVSSKDGGVRIDTEGARKSGFELPRERLRKGEDEAFEQLGADNFEAVAWIALGGVLEDPSPPPWYVATRDRSLISALRSVELLGLLGIVILPLLFALTPPGFFRDREWWNGDMPRDAWGTRQDAPSAGLGGGPSSLGDPGMDDDL